jgi:replication factor C large subunit
MIDWTEKYRPKTFDSLILKPYLSKRTRKTIDPKAELVQWAKTWNKGIPKKKAIILSGKPGIGKTSCAYVIANQFDWIPIELNTSDARNKDRIQAVATTGSQYQSFSNDGVYYSTKRKGRKLIILDEADNLYERSSSSSSNNTNLSDRGGKKEIVHTVQITKQPIILIVNNYFNLIKGSGNPLQKLCLHLEFPQPSPEQILGLLQRISKHEQIDVEKQILIQLSTFCHGDIRSAIRDLQSLCIGKKKVTLDQWISLGFRDHEEEIFNVLSSIFQEKNIVKIKDQVLHLDLDPYMLLLWIVENLPRTYKQPIDLARAYHHVSKADIYLSRTLRRSNYRMWAYASDHMSLGVSFAKTHKIDNQYFIFPSWLRIRKKDGDNKTSDLLISESAMKHHCSVKKAKKEILPYMKQLSMIQERNQQKDNYDYKPQKFEKQKTLFT